MPSQSEVEGAFEKGFALGRQEARSLANAVRMLADLTNEHTVLLQCMMKKMGTNPEELIKLLDQKDFLNDDDVPKPGALQS